MEAIIKMLELRQNMLKKSTLCTFMKNEEYPVSVKLSFAPAMMFFAMGFKDILDSLKVSDTDNALQKIVNIHCEEDSTHWEWYLNDLLRIPPGRSFLQKGLKEMPTEIWSEKYKPVRNVVYDCIWLSRIYNSAFCKLILIEALEATFECFNEPVFEFVSKAGLDEELEYFGQVHAHSEENHSMEKVTGSKRDETYHGYAPNQSEIRDGMIIINTVFNAFTKVFECWFRDAQSRMKVMNQ